LKPMGTITKYYPFIDEESKTMLDSLMEESSSYYDFVQQLCDVALNNEVPVNLAYLATVQAWWCRMRSTVKLLGERHGDVPYIKPWVHVVDSGERDQALAHDAAIESIEKAIENSLDDWVEIDLHILHAFFHHPFGEVISLFEPLEKVKGLINANPCLGCFESVTYAFEGIAKTREGNTKDALEILQKGKALAKIHDDAVYMYMNILQEAIILSVVNVNESALVFEDLYELVQKLKVPAFMTEILNDSSILYETIGEFDLAISCHHEIMRILGDRRLSDTTFLIVSRAYATLGDGKQALEWITKGIEDNEQFESAPIWMFKAWALALIDRIDDAEKALETAYPLVIKAGLELYLGAYYHVSGVIELKKGEFLAAMDLLEKAWEITNHRPVGTAQNRVLLDLARVENLMATNSKDHTKVAVPGKWLSDLEKYASNQDLTGIKMYAALLKSELYQNNEQLKDALNITDSLGVQTLRRKITKRIKDIEQLLQQEGTIS